MDIDVPNDNLSHNIIRPVQIVGQEDEPVDILVQAVSESGGGCDLHVTNFELTISLERTSDLHPY